MGRHGPLLSQSHHHTSHNIMQKLLLLALLSASVSCSPRVRRTEDNPNNEYNGYEQAPYSVIQKYEDFESRTYPAASWACTEGVLTSSSDSDEMFHKLFRYISGENAGQQTIEMTVPVMNRMVETQAGEVTKRMCFYLPNEFPQSPPQPSDEAVSIETIGYDEVLVQTFGGYVHKEEQWAEHAQQFSEEIKSMDMDGFDTSFFTYATYDDPWQVRHRRNEVIFQKL